MANLKAQDVNAALAAWSLAVREAHWNMTASIPEGGLKALDEQRRSILDLVDWLALLMREGHELQPIEAEILDRMEAAFHPHREAIVTVADLAVEHGDRYRLAPEARGPTYQGNTRSEIAAQLISDLASFVNKQYEALASDIGAVRALLDRFQKGRSGRLGGDGLAAELERLAGFPLQTPNPSADGVAEARARKKRRNA